MRWTRYYPLSKSILTAAHGSVSKLKHKPTPHGDSAQPRSDDPISIVCVNIGNKYEFNKTTLAGLIFARAKPDWKAISELEYVEMSKGETRDIWRSKILPNILKNKLWATGSTIKSRIMRLVIVLAVLRDLKPDFRRLATRFPDKTEADLRMSWYGFIVPKLKKGDTIE